MTKLVNRAKMTTATTGTGTITLGSAVDGYQTFADAGVVNADVVRYVIEDGDAWEIGLGTFSAGTLTRGSIESSNADNALNLTGNAVVFVSAAAADLQELVDFADNFVLPTADGSTGQVLTTNGAGTLTFSTITGYSLVGSVTGNATVDLSTGTVFEHTPTADTNFVFNNPPASGTAYEFSLKVTGAEVAKGFRIDLASYDSVSFSVTSEETDPVGLFFKPDGTKMYVVGPGGDEVNEYTLSAAWDITSASFVHRLGVASQDSAPRDVWFKSDGTEVYVVGTGSNSVHQYSLSTAWDVSSGAFTQSFKVSAQSGLSRGLTFKPDGAKMYVSDTSSDAIHQYSLSTAWDISTASYDNKSLSSGTQNPTGPRFNPEGTKIWIVDNTLDTVRQYSLTTAWDVSTGSYDTVSFNVGTQESAAQGLFFKDDGTKMYVVGSGNDTVYQYSTAGAAAAAFTYPASVKWPGGAPPTDPAVGETDLLQFLTTDGGTTYLGRLLGDNFS